MEIEEHSTRSVRQVISALGIEFRTDQGQPFHNPGKVRLADRSSRTADSLQTETSQIAASNGWVTDTKKRENRAQAGIKVHDSTSRK
jgi:hypothetical protein